MSKAELFRKIYESRAHADQWLNSVPYEIRAAFFDNPYIGHYQALLDDVLRELFGEHWDAIEWFLYEWQPGFAVWPGADNEIKIWNIDQYIDYMKTYENFV